MRRQQHMRNISTVSNQKQQSYLLQSYNQNESLFANLNHYQFVGIAITESVTSTKNGNKVHENNTKTVKSSKDKSRPGKEKRESRDDRLHVDMLEAICEDQREDSKTGEKARSRISKSVTNGYRTNNNHNNKDTLYKQLFNHEQTAHIHEPSIRIKSKASEGRQNKQKPEMGWQHSYIDNYNDHDNESEEDGKEASKKLGECNGKIKIIMEFVNELCSKYSGLVQILQKYEWIISKQAQQIQQMNSLINILSKQLQYYTNKIQTFSNSHEPVKDLFSQPHHFYPTQHQHHLNMDMQQGYLGDWMTLIDSVKNDILGVVMFKVQKLGLFATQVSNIPKMMNYTKSVPHLTRPMHTQTNQQHNGQQPQVLRSNQLLLKYQENTPKLQAYEHTNKPKTHIIPFIQNSPLSLNFSFSQSYNICLNPSVAPAPDRQSSGPNGPDGPDGQQSLYYRKLANIRVKQLQAQKIKLQNQLHSSTYKVMVLRNQNRELKEIVEGLIVQVKKMGQQQQNNMGYFYK